MLVDILRLVSSFCQIMLGSGLPVPLHDKIISCPSVMFWLVGDSVTNGIAVLKIDQDVKNGFQYI